MNHKKGTAMEPMGNYYTNSTKPNCLSNHQLSLLASGCLRHKKFQLQLHSYWALAVVLA